MKLSVSSLMVAGTTFLSVANAAGLPSIPDSCLEIPKIVGEKPHQLMQYFHKEVCEKNCSATINQHNQYLHNSVFPHIIQDVNQKLGVSVSEQQQYNQTTSQVVAAVHKSCAAEGNKPLCNDVKGLFDYGACAFKASQPIIESHIKQVSGSIKLTDEKCNKIKALDSDNTVWQKTLPAYVDKFAQLCEKDSN